MPSADVLRGITVSDSRFWHRAARAAVRFKVRCSTLTRPSADIVASSAVLDLNGSEGWFSEPSATRRLRVVYFLAIPRPTLPTTCSRWQATRMLRRSR